MKKLLLVLMLLASVASAAPSSPKPRYIKVIGFALNETVFLGVRGKQTNAVYPAIYVTLKPTQAVKISFDNTEDVAGFFTGVISAGWGGGLYDAAVEPSVHLASDEKVTFRTTAMSLKFVTVPVPGDLEVWVEYEK